MSGKAAARVLGPGALLLAMAVGVAGCNGGDGQAAKPVIEAAPKPEPTLAQAREIAMSGIASVGGGYRATLDEDGSGRAWRDGVPGVVPVAWSVLDSSKTTLPRPAASGQPAAPTVDPATGKTLPAPPTGMFAICVELPLTLDIPGGHHKCTLARDWKTQPRTVAPAATARTTTAPKPAPAPNAG
ncbi:hypothetical protein [Labrys neptuniae]